MTLKVNLPFGKADNAKNLAFTILSRESPLKIIELTNLMKKRYAKSVTFQAVRKAILELVAEGVLEKQGKEFSIRKEWVRETKKWLDGLYSSLVLEKKEKNSIESIGAEISVFSFNSLSEMMEFWYDLIEDWEENFKKGDPNVNCHQGAHCGKLCFTWIARKNPCSL